MEINITTPALLFPAISLLLLAYTNRFLTLAGIVRGLANRGRDQDADTGNVDRQIDNLQLRIQLIKWMQFCGVLSFSCCVIAMILLFVDREASARVIFAVSLILLLISLAVSAWETLLSGEALRLELERCGKKNRRASPAKTAD